MAALLVSGIQATAQAKSANCFSEAQVTLKKSIKSFGITQKIQLDNMQVNLLKNSYDEKVYKYVLPALQLDETSYIPESSAEVILRDSDCQVLKVSVEAFSGLN